MYAAIICLIGGGINGNLPIRTRELAKSLALGFGLNAAAALSKVTSG